MLGILKSRTHAILKYSFRLLVLKTLTLVLACYA
jgi:hypothetical protein